MRQLISNGNPGVTAIDDTGTGFALGQNLVLLRADGSRVLPEFLRWLVHTPEWWEQIEKYRNDGAVFSSLKCRDVPKFELTIPPIAEQETINSILRPISDKIELNRRMNETLEEMARALFWDWFVDFGPTRRQMEGATDPTVIMGHAFPPQKAATLAPLFPAKLGDGVLVEQLQQNVTVDWHRKESARAKLRVLVRRILKKYGYPPDLAPIAINTVLSQAETLLHWNEAQ